MARKPATKKTTKSSSKTPARSTKKTSIKALSVRKVGDVFSIADPELHVYGNSQVCSTNSIGRPMPENRSPAEIVVDASEGFVPLWSKNVTLRWRFNEGSMRCFQNPEEAKGAIRELWGEALLAWGDAAP